MSRLSNIVFRLYQRTLHSLALYPTLIALSFFALCLLVMSIEYQPWLMSLKQIVDVGLVRNADNARLILGTLVGGIMTLMVFSFSMVMVVLNNAAASLSPRVIPGLISDKGHQKTLGFYLGTILFSLLLITSIEQENSTQVPSLGVLIALCLGIACLGLFVHFIHSISRSIQVEYILNNLYRTTLEKLTARETKLAGVDDMPSWPDDQHWQEVFSRHNGYFKELNNNAINTLLCQHDLRMTVMIHRGFFVMSGRPLFKLDRQVDPEIANALLDCFDFFLEEYAHSHYLFGCTQMSEIAVKALSPGINDPGTAITAIDLLSVLFSKRLALPDLDVTLADDGPPRLLHYELSLDDLLQQVFGPIRHYGCSDVSVLLSLLRAFKNLLYQPLRATQKTDLLRHVRSVQETADQHLSNSRDRQAINQVLERINQTGSTQEPVALLAIPSA
ncbi:MAG: DUF2254 domain-containing protein [Pseudomonas sp.]|uniref:DUF2254 domain-containing protein n=1 Tax=Pseudomonas sp. TaxID=306 RepID=UPI0027204F64|nr:DUF2254 domain-containing protein [Pseudomonas sp.]MDO9618099.1 DUF2254 domain-containing protein [Pseudomonas sp.]MDP2446713.1 DUF2254 domain-containing protein [Pseudomonas sp.]MDZ4337274.1 DUF2254 domain-containing protein [Pseudomonas sp.]